MTHTHLRWHRYGSVEVALAPAKADEIAMVSYARYIAPVTKPGAHPVGYDDRVFRLVEPLGDDDYWVVDSSDERVEHIALLFDAAITLEWHEYLQFQAADRAMGDPCP